MSVSSLIYMMIAIIFFLSITTVISLSVRKAKTYNTSAGPVNDKLNVHLVPHTHDDVGWLKTVDEYFMGLNNTIQHAGVQYILDTVVDQLSRDPNRKFIYVEVAFFMRWWNEQDDDKQSLVRKLINDGQLSFVNGGWTMADESSVYYEALIDEMTLGHRFILEQFGEKAKPTIGWHIDPFGHSSATARMFATMDFEAFFFGRIDYDDKKTRLRQKEMEVIWRGSASLGEASDIFTSVTYNGYGPPDGFCWDQSCTDAPMQDDENIENYNIKYLVDKFVDAAFDQASHYRTPNILMTMGSDFQYENALLWFKNLDKLIHYVNLDGRINVFYSNPMIYVDEVHKAGLEWTVKTDDFFPYADCPWCFWTGYFTSRPSIKGYVRFSNNYLQVCRQMEAIQSHSSSSSRPSATLERAMGVLQHHDAVSGTEKQHVADDYALRLAVGVNECESFLDHTFTKLINGNVTFSQCLMSNISICVATQKEKNGLAVVLYNPLGHSRSEYVRLPIDDISISRIVLGPDLNNVSSQYVFNDASGDARISSPGHSKAAYALVFQAVAPAMGYTTYFVKNTGRKSEPIQKPIDDTVTAIGNDIISVNFDSHTGRISSMINKEERISIKLDQTFLWWNSSTGNSAESGQTSGAYIFRPNGTDAWPLPNVRSQVITKVTKGSVVQEVHQTFSPSVSQVVRVYADSPCVEVEWTVGPIPIDDGLGKEYISRFSSSIDSGDVFFTDAQGLDMQRRVRNMRKTWKYHNTEPVAGNYYPVNSAIALEDTNARITILTDRSEAGSSLGSGQLELMVHRRILRDDYRGVGEPLNETNAVGDGLVVRGRHWILLSSPEKAASLHRPLAMRVAHPSVLAFASMSNPTVWSNEYPISFSAAHNMPANVHLLTFQSLENGKTLVRFAHIYEAGDEYALPSTINMADIFKIFGPVEAVELNLSANQRKTAYNRRTWKKKTSSSSPNMMHQREQNNSEYKNGLTVTLNPMEIRTFLVKFNKL